jgi:hypothetical protein
VRIILRFTAICLFACAAAWSQAVSTSQIKGTVQDSTGLAVPGAEVKVTQKETNLIRVATTDTDGSYVLANLPVGPYQLEVTKQGFSRFVQTGIILQVASNPTIDVSLTIGAVTESVRVEAAATMVETQSTGVGSVIDGRRVLDLPLVGRQVSDLIYMVGAAVPGGDANLVSTRTIQTTEVSVSVAGGLGSGASYVLDGAMHNDPYTNLNEPLPFPEALQEFKVETSALPAQYGMHSAAAVNAITKSGTNDWHGAAFEFVRNYEFNARNFFAQTRDTLKRNQYGGTFGGPIMKNKLFFFVGYQGTPTRQDAVQNSTEHLPTADMLAGDFTAATSATCNGGKAITLKDPATGQPFAPLNQIPVSRFSKPAINIASKLPSNLIIDQCGRVNYGAANIQDQRDSVGRVDYQLSSSHTLFARYIGTNLVQPAPFSSSGDNLLTTAAFSSVAGSGVDDLVQTLTLGDTYIISPNAVNSFRATLNRSGIARVGAQFFGPQDVGINIFSYLPKYTTLSVTGGFNIGGATDTDATYKTTTLQMGEDVSWVRGKHQISFGANIAHWNSNTYARVLAMGQLSFNGQATNFGLADFLTGSLFSLAQAPPNTLLVRQWYTGLYAQDTWKIRPRITLSYGLRWEPYFPMRFAQGLIYQFDQGRFNAGIKSSQFANAPAGLFYPGDPGFPDNTGMNKQWKDFAPRLGLAWDPKGDGKTSIRASYGIFYDLIPVQYHLNTETAPPFFVRNNLTSPAGGLADPYLGQPGGNPFPITLTANSPFPTFATFNTFDFNSHTTYVEQWNLSIQHQIAQDWLLSVSYLGSQMVHLFTETELNPAICNPGAICTTATTNQRRKLVLQDPKNGVSYGFVDKWDDGGTGNYNGLLLSAQKRFSHGFTVGANYTWSHCISDVTNSLPNGGAGGSGIYIFGNNRRLDRGNCSTSAVDHRYLASMTAVDEIPKFSAITNKWLDQIVSGWRVASSVSMASGSYYTVTTGQDNAFSGEGGQRPNLNTGVSTSAIGTSCPTAPCVSWLNPAAFTLPTSGTYGNLSTANLLGPGALNVNASLSRLFKVRERQVLELRADSQNLLNRANFANPGASMAATANFGKITSTAPGQLGTPRIMQFAVKYTF